MKLDEFMNAAFATFAFTMAVLMLVVMLGVAVLVWAKALDAVF